MRPTNDIKFGRFRLDVTNECLWHGAQAISLCPKAFAVLKLLVENAGQLVTKQQVLDKVWPGTFVTDAVLKDSIRQLRDALGDDAESPTYIETAHRRGYRFIANLSGHASGRTNLEAENGAALVQDLQPEVGPLFDSYTPAGVLGRDTELGKMCGWMKRALAGERQIVFVTGEAGIGKTTLVQALLQRTKDIHGILIARGQCLEHYGAGEAYLPVLDGIARLGRSPDGTQVVDLLRQHAPTWLAQMSSLVSPSERESLRAQMLGATRERMLREMAEALEILTTKAPLLLVLEDLHWSDYSTLDLISYVARRRDPARLMLIGTYRPVEVILGEHALRSLKGELVAHGLCREL